MSNDCHQVACHGIAGRTLEFEERDAARLYGEVSGVLATGRSAAGSELSSCTEFLRYAELHDLKCIAFQHNPLTRTAR